MKHLKDATENLTSKLISTLDNSVVLKKDGVDPMIPFAFVYYGTNDTIKTFLGDSPEYADKMFESIQSAIPLRTKFFQLSKS